MKWMNIFFNKLEKTNNNKKALRKWIIFIGVLTIIGEQIFLHKMIKDQEIVIIKKSMQLHKKYNTTFLETIKITDSIHKLDKQTLNVKYVPVEIYRKVDNLSTRLLCDRLRLDSIEHALNNLNNN